MIKWPNWETQTKEEAARRAVAAIDYLYANESISPLRVLLDDHVRNCPECMEAKVRRFSTHTGPDRCALGLKIRRLLDSRASF